MKRPFTAPHLPQRTVTVLVVSFIYVATLCLTALTATAADRNEELLALLASVEASYAKVEDYSTRFLKQERVENVLLPEEAIFLKFKKPSKIYMKWINGPLKEALYIEGENNEKVVAHKDGTGLSLTWNLSPTGSTLLAGNRHPITDIGFGFIVNLMRTIIPMAVEHREIEIIRLNDAPFKGRPAIVLEVRLTPKEGRKYYAAHIICYIDKEYLLPVGITTYDEKEVLLEDYSYTDVKINSGLTDMDFSKENPDYDF
ncbi:Outer membrane lipoprotein-sorting protein [Desulfovibrio gilichinskyi]|uniref:Outer membrane lipoprotein-sorting protein n=1 Tax=Desulfovibrio gilichinskyi TaxID=1519643 RepID=A0A1X7EXW5_9BACT|nr:Outer membrane lipoprotein-sorting protein [Desulfovibrio gilichinskyi]